jgi:hypothetical protein
MRLLLLLGLSSFGLFTGCGGTTSSNTPGGYSVDTTSLSSNFTRAYLTDKTLADSNIVSVTVAISKLAVHTSATAGDTSAGWQSFPITPAKSIDLLTLTNKKNTIISDLAISAGTYQQIRMTVDSVTLTFKDGTTAAATVPSGIIRFNLGVSFVLGNSYGIMIDFDPNNLVQNSQGWHLKPVVKIVEVFLVNADGTTTPLTQTQPTCSVNSDCTISALTTCCPAPAPASNLICVDTTSDASNCGSCGNACASGQTCTASVCG